MYKGPGNSIGTMAVPAVFFVKLTLLPGWGGEPGAASFLRSSGMVWDKMLE